MKKIDLKNLDNKSKIEIAVTSIMVIALVIILSNSLKVVFGAKRPVRPPSVEPVAFREIAKRDISISTKTEEIEKAYKEAEAKRVEQDTPWGRDPFAVVSFLQEGEWTVADLRLEGILWDEETPCAVINGEVFKKGDKIGKNTIIQIEKDGIIVSDGARRYRLCFW